KVWQTKYQDQIKNISLIVNVATIFPTIEMLVKRYLQPNVTWFLINQMKESIFYTACRTSIKEVKEISTNEPSNSENLEDEYDSVYICARFLLDRLNCANISEIWNVSRITNSDVNHIVFCLEDGSYSCTCLLQQKQGLVCRHFFHLLNVTKVARFSIRLINVRWISRKLREEAMAESDHFGLRFTSVENSGMQISHVTKRFEWLQLFVYISEENNVNGDNDFIEKQLFYGKQTCIKKAQQTNQKSDLNDSDKENNFSDFRLRNPLKVSTRGRPKLASHRNNSKRNLQPIHDESATKRRRQNQCSYCKEVGHNIAICTKKDIDE
ncbi:7715_t:CDS:2, partial [Gigaspora rosea]